MKESGRLQRAPCGHASPSARRPLTNRRRSSAHHRGRHTASAREYYTREQPYATPRHAHREARTRTEATAGDLTAPLPRTLRRRLKRTHASTSKGHMSRGVPRMRYYRMRALLLLAVLFVYSTRTDGAIVSTTGLVGNGTTLNIAVIVNCLTPSIPSTPFPTRLPASFDITQCRCVSFTWAHTFDGPCAPRRTSNSSDARSDAPRAHACALERTCSHARSHARSRALSLLLLALSVARLLYLPVSLLLVPFVFNSHGIGAYDDWFRSYLTFDRVVAAGGGIPVVSTGFNATLNLVYFNIGYGQAMMRS
jgi:hypothetical protein